MMGVRRWTTCTKSSDPPRDSGQTGNMLRGMSDCYRSCRSALFWLCDVCHLFSCPATFSYHDNESNAMMPATSDEDAAPCYTATGRRRQRAAGQRQRLAAGCQAGRGACSQNWQCPRVDLASFHGVSASRPQGRSWEAGGLQHGAQRPAAAVCPATRHPTPSAAVAAPGPEVRGDTRLRPAATALPSPCPLWLQAARRQHVCGPIQGSRDGAQHRRRRRRLSPPPSTCAALCRPARRVHAAQVCRAWREATLSPALWQEVYFRLPRDDDEETAEAFVSWLLPRVGQVETLHIDINEVAQVGAGAPWWELAGGCSADAQWVLGGCCRAGPRSPRPPHHCLARAAGPPCRADAARPLSPRRCCAPVQPPNQAAEFVVGVMSNLTAALMCVAGSLRSLVFETQGVLVISQWAAALTRLESACFIGGEVHLKQVGAACRLRWPLPQHARRRSAARRAGGLGRDQPGTSGV